MNAIQLDFLQDVSEVDLLRTQVNMLYERIEKVRKGQYAKIGAQAKEIMDLKERFYVIERALCQTTK